MSTPQPPAPPSASPAPVLAPAVLAQLRALDPDGSSGFIKRLLTTYAQSLERLGQEVRRHVDESDFAAAGVAAHTLKSASASVGALALAGRCEEIEHMVRRHDTASIPERLDGFLAEVQRVQQAVQAELASAST